jgi:hypothetical protein
VVLENGRQTSIYNCSKTFRRGRLAYNDCRFSVINAKMRYSTILALGTTVAAFSLTDLRGKSVRSVSTLKDRSPGIEGGKATCPTVWTHVVSDLKALFLDTIVKPSQCNDNARGAIRV